MAVRQQRKSGDVRFCEFENVFLNHLLDEFFDRLDKNNDTLIDFNDYLQRNPYFVEMSRREFQKLDQNRMNLINFYENKRNF